MTEIKNAVVSEFQIGFSETQSLTAWLVVNFGMAKQGFGGLDLSNDNAAAKFIAGVLNIVGVGTVEQLAGKAVRVEHDETKIYKLGNFIDSRWLSIDTLEITDGIVNVDETQVEGAEGQAATTETATAADSAGSHSMNAEAGVIGTN